MCLAIPGKILDISGEGEQRTGRVDFSGVAREACLACVPEAKVGDYVIVHVGFALSVVDEVEALQTLAYLREMGELCEAETVSSQEGVER